MITFKNEKIKEQREKLRMLPIEITNEIGISLNEYRQIESGLVIPTNDIAKKLCSILELDIKQIYNIKGNKRETISLSLFNSKGGVGKSTITHSLAYSLAIKGYKVLCVDLDAQCNLTTILKPKPNDKDIMDLFSSRNPEKFDVHELITKTVNEKIDLIKGSFSIDKIHDYVVVSTGKELILSNALKEIRQNNEYDFIIFDNSPSISLAINNSIYACNYAIAPINISQKFALDGLERLYDIVNENLSDNYNFKDLKILINVYDRRNKDVDIFYNRIKEIYERNLLKTIIRVDINFENAQKRNQSIFEYAKNTRGIEDCMNLADEILKLD